MATFLTTPRMAPALAARVEASVRGKRRKAGGPFAPRAASVFRLVMAGAIALAILGIAALRRHEHQELEHTRAALLDSVRSQGASLTDEQKGFVGRAEAALGTFGGAYAGDLVADEVRGAGLAATLARPAVYVRGPIAAFASAAALEDAAASSAKDPLLLCLVDPPASRAEKTLLPDVRVAYAAGPHLEQRTANVRRLYDAQAGLPVLLPAWSERVRAAEEAPELARLGRELDRAPVERAKRAATATLLIVAVDEPGDGPGPTELDGERAHAVRVGVFDLTASKVLLRLRKRVDPSWISAAKRPEFASGLDGCALALDVRAAVELGAVR